MLSLFHRQPADDEAGPRSAPIKLGEETETPGASTETSQVVLNEVARVNSEDGLIPADELPSAAEALAELFPPEPVRVEPERAISRLGARLRFLWPRPGRSKPAPTDSAETSSELALGPATEASLDAPADAPLPVPKEAAAEPGSDAQAPVEQVAESIGKEPAAIAADANADFAEVAAPEAPASMSEDAAAARPEPAETSASAGNPAEAAVAGIAEPEQGAVRPGSPQGPTDELSAPEPAAAESAAENSGLATENAEADPAPSSLSSAAIENAAPPAVDAETTPVMASAEYSAAASPAPSSDWAFEEKLACHREWLESQGMAGRKADLAGAELEGHELIGVHLRYADLHDANLRAADLLLADLRDACLVRADLEDACLVGANLEGANLEGATLETAMGLVPRQLAGANLRDALLPPPIMEFEAAARFERASRTAFRYFVALTGTSLLSWLAIWETKDVQLLTNSAAIPLLHSRTAAAALPIAESYLLAPLLLCVLYLVFHFQLQRMWSAVLELPAVFPDGHALEEDAAGMVGGLLRAHFRWINQDASSTLLVEKYLSMGLAYWMVPATLALFWARYLTRQEIHGTILQGLLVVIGTGAALHATTKTGRPQERWARERKWAERVVARLKGITPAATAVALGAVLAFLSAGTIAGVPHERGRAPQYGPANIRRWAPAVLWTFGFDPYADLTEASISPRPADGTAAPVAEEALAGVTGPRLNNARFRYAQAYGIFLANAHLWRADFEGAFLSDADLRGADLGQSSLRFASADGARMSHANLNRANLEGIDLSRAELREANLSYASLVGATAVDARLDAAVLYSARLSGATLARANLERADLREAFLDGAHLDHADFRGAYLWSAKLPGADLGGAHLENAILIGANLRGANLGGAQLSGTVLNEADLSGTSLEGADLRGALGLSASQVCSAKSQRGALLDEAMQVQVEAQCGK
jgi:uncharacterized protein YjbI with pentapeptide repeats